MTSSNKSYTYEYDTTTSKYIDIDDNQIQVYYKSNNTYILIDKYGAKAEERLNEIGINNGNIQYLIDDWVIDPTNPIFTDSNNEYYIGHISDWDVSKVTDMKFLFYKKKNLMMILVIGMSHL